MSSSGRSEAGGSEAGFWLQFESGRERRRRLAFERSCQAAAAVPICTSGRADTEAASQASKLHHHQQQHQQHQQQPVGSVEKSRRNKHDIVEPNAIEIDQDCVADLSKTITGVIKKSSDCFKGICDSGASKVSSSKLTSPKNELASATDRFTGVSTEQDHVIKRNKRSKKNVCNTLAEVDSDSVSAKDTEMRDFSKQSQLIGNTEQRQFHHEQATHSYAAIVRKAPKSEQEPISIKKEKKDEKKSTKENQSGSETLVCGVWIDKRKYDEAENDLYASKSKLGKISETDSAKSAIVERAHETDSSQIVCEGVWLNRNTFNNAETAFQERRQKEFGRNISKSEISINQSTFDTDSKVVTVTSLAENDTSLPEPTSLQLELHDMYFEDMILPGLNSGVTMAVTPGFTATPLSESLLPEEQLDSLQAEPQFESMSELKQDSLVTIPVGCDTRTSHVNRNVKEENTDNISGCDAQLEYENTCLKEESSELIFTFRPNVTSKDSSVFSESLVQQEADLPKLLKVAKINENTAHVTRQSPKLQNTKRFNAFFNLTDRIIPTCSVSRPILPDKNMYLSIDEGKTYASLMQQGSDMLAARPVFLANACHVCKQTHSKQVRLKSCGSCGMVAYCSAQHQRAHWPLHRAFCKVVSNYAQRLGVKHIYGEALNVFSGDQWRSIRLEHMNKCEAMLDRPLEIYEKEMFLSPRACETCHETSSDRLRTCSNCHLVNFCCQQHLRPNHDKFCKDMRLLLEIQRHHNRRGVCNPTMPNTVLDTYQHLPGGIREFLVSDLLGASRANRMTSVELAMLSEHASSPLSLLYAWQKVRQPASVAPVEERRSLVVHVVGVELTDECDNVAKWERFFLNLLPHLSALKVVLISGDSTRANDSQGGAGGVDSTTKDLPSESTRSPGKKFLCEIRRNVSYHDYCTDDSYIRPDVVCVLNASLNCPVDEDSCRHWWKSLFKSYPTQQHTTQHILLLITDCEELEVLQHVRHAQQESQPAGRRTNQEHRLSLLVPPTKNPYRSLRPHQNFANERECPLTYRNNYFACLAWTQ